MCRWVGYVGSPIEPRELLYDPERSLIEQSRRHAPAMPVPNGDGFGLGWYGRREIPAVFHSATPAWGDRNLHSLASEISSPLFLAHVRAATGTPVQETNCHPFVHGRWLFVHNGYVAGYERLRRDMMRTVRPELFPEIRGTTDSELMFHLALTFGLAGDPIGALERMAGFVEALGARAGVPEPLQMTVGSPTESACTPRATPAARRSTRCTTAQTWTHCDSCIRPRSGSHTSAPKRGPWSPNTRRATRAVARGPGGVGPDGGERPGRPDPVHATATGVDRE
jgi:predicted glutamine amidotransferase